ncbi:RidA family protein [Paenibacillus sp. HJGM_3]|uniref:RidA family protein n=1 Tax=Paenibacillus sp. HJGM_3 TaxID=3379816 RepID=UPI00385F8A91
MKEYFGVKNSTGLAYSQAIRVNDTLYVAGQGPSTLECTPEEQVRQTLENVRAVLAEVGLDLSDVVKVTAVLNYDYVTPQLFEGVYTDFFQSPYPVRTVIKSDIGFNVQVDVVAVFSR